MATPLPSEPLGTRVCEYAQQRERHKCRWLGYHGTANVLLYTPTAVASLIATQQKKEPYSRAY